MARQDPSLSDTEARYRAFFDHARDAMLAADDEGRYVDANPAACALLGYTRDELLALTVWDVTPSASLDEGRRLWQAFIAGGQLSGEYAMVRKDGTLVRVEFSAVANVRPGVHLTTHREISERGYAESHLLKEVSWRVAEAADTDTALASVMRLACESLGWAFAEAWVMAPDNGGLVLSPVWHSADRRFDVFRAPGGADRLPLGAGMAGGAWTAKRPIWTADVTESTDFGRRDLARQAGLRAALAVPIVVDDGAAVETVLILYATAARPEDERLVGLFSAVAAQLGAAMQRKRAELALSSTQVLLRSVVTRAPIIMFAVDRNGLFTMSEGAGLEPLGLTAGDVVGLSAFNVYRDVPAVVEHLRRALSGESFIGVADVGARAYQTWYTPRRDANGEVIGVLGVATDITERRQLEEQLRQAQKLESVGLLAGGIAHDFNNLLTAITGYAELVLDAMPPGGRMREDVEGIRAVAARAALLTYQLLAFSRKQILRPTSLNLNEVVNDVSRMLRRVIGENIHISIQTGHDIGSVSADPGQLAQVIMNLSVNARDAMPDGGTLTIQTANVKIDHEHGRAPDSAEPGAYVMLAVTDTGSGMPPEVRQRVFEPFFTTKGVGKGTGMGLATVYGIVKQSGGHISVDSEIGQGSSFKVYLPRVLDATAVRDRAANDAEFPRGSETLLLVEDEEVVRRLARRALEACGYRVLEAEDGAAALALFEGSLTPIDLLITDVVMPRMSGRELVQRLSDSGRRCDVLYMSGYTDHAIVHDGILDGGIEFIQKPFSMRALAQKVREVLDARRRRR